MTKRTSIQERLHDACIDFARNGRQEDNVTTLFNKYAAGICRIKTSREAMVGHREIIAQHITIACIHALSWTEQEKLQEKLYECARN